MSKQYGYCRISTSKQEISRQIRNIEESYPNATIVEEVYTGTKTIGRKEWCKLIKKVKADDTIIFDSVSRMSRNADEGFKTYMDLYNRGVNLVFLKESTINTDSYKSVLENQQLTTVSTSDKDTDDFVNGIMAQVAIYITKLAQKQIKKAFEQSEKEVLDLHKRTSEGMKTAKIKGKQIGQKQGNKLTTKKSIKAKEIIKKHNKTFGGDLNNDETIKLADIDRMTFYKYKKELLSELNNQQ